MIIRSILDTDLYKFTQQMAIAGQYPRVDVEYAFIDRGGTTFPDGFAVRLRHEVQMMSHLRLEPHEEEFLRSECYYLKPNYVDMLRGYRFDPTQVEISQEGGKLSVLIRGPWYLTVLWEVPLMATISELYFDMTDQKADPQWEARAIEKFDRMSEAELVVSDFGSRRRFSFGVQDSLVNLLAMARCCAGTSNVYLAWKHGLKAIGTMAHEWGMAHAAMFGYRMATKMMLEAWVREYDGELGIALPDTFTADVFFREFNTLYAKLFDGVRWDSGEWQWFADAAIAHYQSLRIDPMTKAIVFSDSLNDETAIKIGQYCKGKILARFGIGTFLTNDVGCKPLHMVIKMTLCNGRPTVKLSDSSGKALGPAEEILHCKRDLGIIALVDKKRTVRIAKG